MTTVAIRTVANEPTVKWPVASAGDASDNALHSDRGQGERSDRSCDLSLAFSAIP